jgi:ParB family chromosome partitioning protein
MEVPIDLIRPSPYQPRLTFNVEDLRQEIEKDGLLSNLIVRQLEGHYELIDGERRLRILRELGWQTVPVEIRDIDDQLARRLVYKLNKIRASYEPEEEAKYFKKLADEEGMKLYQIAKEYNIDERWVRACLNIFKLPEDIQIAVWEKRLSIGHIQDLEPVIARDVEEASEIARETINRSLSRDAMRKVLRPRYEEIERARIEAAQKALSERAPTPLRLETPKDFEVAAKTLLMEARRQREEAITPEERAAIEAEKRRRLEERQRRAEERIRHEEEERRQIEEDAMRQALKDPEFLLKAVQEAEKILPSTALAEPAEAEVTKERKLVDEIDVGDVECPLCQKRLRLLHCKPTGGKPSPKDAHKVQEIVQ